MAAPWFKIYSQQFLSDPKLKLLNHDQIGKLVTLWAFANEAECCIPSDIKAIARLLGVQGKNQMDNLLVLVGQFFVPVDGDDSRLISIRLRDEQRAYEDKCQKLRENGRKGGRPEKPNGSPDGLANGKPNGLANENQMGLEEGRGKKEKEKDKNPAAPPLRSRTTEPSGVKNPEKPKTPKTGPTVNEILADHDPASYWQLSRLFPGARSSNHRTAAVYWVAAINSGIAGPALVKAGKDFFESMPPDQIGKGAVPQMAKWLEQEGFRTFLPEDQPAPPPQVSEAERQGRMADAAAFLEAKCLNPALTFEAWRNNHAA